MRGYLCRGFFEYADIKVAQRERDVRYFERRNLSMGLVHRKSFGLM